MATSAHDIAALIAAASPDELDALAQRYADDPRKQVARALERALKAENTSQKISEYAEAAIEHIKYTMRAGN